MLPQYDSNLFFQLGKIRVRGKREEGCSEELPRLVGTDPDSGWQSRLQTLPLLANASLESPVPHTGHVSVGYCAPGVLCQNLL